LEALDHEFAFLASSVERTIEVQQEGARHLLDVSPPQGKALARHLVVSYDKLKTRVARRREGYASLPDEESKRGAVIEMRLLVEGARNLHGSLSWLDAAREPPLDLGTRYLIDFIACRLVSVNAEVTVVTAVERSYRTAIEPLSLVLSAIDEELSEDSPPAIGDAPDGSDDGAPGGDADGQGDGLAIVVFVPRREQHSGLLHPLIVHELGHAASSQHGLASGLVATTASHPEVGPALEVAVEALATDMELETELRTDVCEAVGVEVVSKDETEALTRVARSYLMAQLEYWVEEAVCDAFAVQLLGPTYLYAFTAIVGASDLDAVDPQHPPTRQRLRLMLTQLDELGWSDLLAAETPDVEAWFREQARVALRYHDDVPPRFCQQALELLAGDVRELVARHVGGLSFLPAAFGPDRREEVVSLLAAGIPPAQALDVETGERRPIGRAEIILGSWLFAMAKEGGGLGALGKAPGLPELRLLLPKALELSALATAWNGGTDAAAQ
jgi:hypothetical protein